MVPKNKNAAVVPVTLTNFMMIDLLSRSIKGHVDRQAAGGSQMGEDNTLGKQ